MITKGIWKDFDFKCKDKNYFDNKYTFEDKNIAWVLIFTVILTPFTFIIDLICFPIEFVYCLALKKIKKLRK